VKKIVAVMSALGWDMPVAAVKTQYVPDQDELASIREVGAELGAVIKGSE